MYLQKKDNGLYLFHRTAVFPQYFKWLVFLAYILEFPLSINIYTMCPCVLASPVPAHLVYGTSSQTHFIIKLCKFVLTPVLSISHNTEPNNSKHSIYMLNHSHFMFIQVFYRSNTIGPKVFVHLMITYISWLDILFQNPWVASTFPQMHSMSVEWNYRNCTDPVKRAFMRSADVGQQGWTANPCF